MIRQSIMGFIANYLMNLGNLCIGREPVRPLLFSYYLTHRCDLGCRYCCDGEGKRFKETPIPELGAADVRRLLTILRGAGDTLDITGGEPLVREDLEEILAHARAIGFRTVLNTKGIGLARRAKLLQYADVLVLSIDTLDPESLARVVGRPRAVAEEIIAALTYAVGACCRSRTKLVLSCVATPDNLAEVDGVLDFAMQHRLGFQVSPEILGTEVNPALRDNADYRQLISQVLDAKRDVGGVLGVPEYFAGIRDFRGFRCHPLLMPVIRPDGRMLYPCLEGPKAEIDLLEAGSYWNGLRIAKQRAGDIPPCQDCCHIFCHMALSLLQTHPLAAVGELKHWRLDNEPAK